MRNKRSSMLAAGIGAVLLGAVSTAQPQDVMDPSGTAPDATGTETQQSTQPGTHAPGDVGTSQSSPTTDTTMGTAGSGAGSASTTSVQGDQRTGSSAATQGDGGSVAWVLVPVSLETQSSQMMKGCWVRLYSGDNFEGRYLTIGGPADIAELRSPYGTGLNNWESAVVGPGATVTTFDDQGFRARNATLRPGMRYAELDDTKLGLFEDIESLRIRCSESSSRGSSQPGTP